MKNKNVLISGAGIAGLTLADWLKQYGFVPTIVEKQLRLLPANSIQFRKNWGLRQTTKAANAL